MLQWRNTSSLSSCNFLNDQVSAPHRRRFIGMARKRLYLLYTSRWGLRQTSFILPMEALAEASRDVMGKSWVSLSWSYVACLHSVCPGSCSSSSSAEFFFLSFIGLVGGK